MPKLSGIADSCHVIEVGPVILQKRNQLWCGAISEAEHNSVIHAVGDSVARNAPEERGTGVLRPVDSLDVPLFHIGPDAMPRGGQMDQVPFRMTVRSQRQIDEGC